LARPQTDRYPEDLRVSLILGFGRLIKSQAVDANELIGRVLSEFGAVIIWLSTGVVGLHDYRNFFCRTPG
jgi:hypothetical protein